MANFWDVFEVPPSFLDDNLGWSNIFSSQIAPEGIFGI